MPVKARTSRNVNVANYHLPPIRLVAGSSAVSKKWIKSFARPLFSFPLSFSLHLSSSFTRVKLFKEKQTLQAATLIAV